MLLPVLWPAVLAASAGLVPHSPAASCPNPGLPHACCPLEAATFVDPVLRAIDTIARQSGDPECTRQELLERLRGSPMCYLMPATQAELEALIAATRLQPNWGVGRPADRFDIASWTWSGEAEVFQAYNARRAHLTYSFVPDGVQWDGQTNVLNTYLSLFEAGIPDAGREYLRQSLAAWEKYAGITFDEVNDSGIPVDSVTTRRDNVGDIRIAAIPLSPQTNASTLAYNRFPSSGGDMTFNVLKFTENTFYNPDDSFRIFRNVTTHELGHGLGFQHQVPCDHTKLMEPFLTSAFDVLQVDERRGAGRHYGDRYSGNQTAATAHDFGVLTRTAGPNRLVIEEDLSTNGAGGANGTSEDWFRFSIGSAQNVQILVSPSGGDYSTTNQVDGCDGDTPIAQTASAAGNLSVELRDESGSTIIAAANATGPGVAELVSAPNLAPGTYTVRVKDVGPNTPELVQLYTLRITPGFAMPAPYANAGINKRINAGALCSLMGDINSKSYLGPVAYLWDTDGDGSFERIGPRQTVVYPASAGVVNVSLMVMDMTFGMADIDTIKVSVIGSAPTLSSISPSPALRNRTTPVTLNGLNLFGMTQTNELSITGNGLTLFGTPQVSQTGTQVTGLSVTVSPTATIGPRDVTIRTPSGSATIAGGLTIAAPAPVLTSLTGSAVAPGGSTQVTLLGSDFHQVSSVSVSGTGVSVTGTPQVNSQGDRVTGLTFTVAPGATPGQRSVTITTPGGSDTEALFTVVPNNDMCANAIDVSAGGVFSGTLVGATNDGTAACGSSSASPDVWYRYTAGDCSTFLDVTTCGTNDTPSQDAGMDTVLSFHFGSCGGTVIDCNDNAVASPCGSMDAGNQRDSRVSAILPPHQTGYIRVSRPSAGFSGAFIVRVSARAQNSICEGAMTVSNGSIDFDGTCSSAPGARFCDNTNPAPGLWFAYNATCTGPVSVRLCGGTEALLSLYSGNCAGLTSIACRHLIPVASCPDTTPAFTFNATAGTRYLLCYTQFNGIPLARGTLTITPGPTNNSCASAAPISTLANFDTTCGQGTSSATCAGSGSNFSAAVWYEYTASCTGIATANTCGSSLNTFVNVYEGTCLPLVPLACNDNQGATCPGQPNSSLATFPTIAGQVYLIRVGGAGGATGTGTLSISCTVPPGACCRGSTCAVATAAACTAPGTSFAGVGTACNAPGNFTTACCKADYNRSGALTVQDIFDFLSAYFAGNPWADINDSGAVSVQDVFDFLAAYFGGCV